MELKYVLNVWIIIANYVYNFVLLNITNVDTSASKVEVLLSPYIEINGREF